jgi:ABC-type dipeptide/oligopeptide/nickel transport system permease subunit
MKTKTMSAFKEKARILFSRGIVTKLCFALVVLFVLVAIFAPLLTRYTPYEQNLTNTLAGPSLKHLLGTDDLGRDMLTRILYGARISCITGIVSSLWAALFGITMGLMAGYFQGAIGQFIMRLIDAQMSIPPLILTMFMAMIMGKSLFGICIVIGIGTIPIYTRMLYGMVLSIKENDYIIASSLIGQNKVKILLKHILPNCFAPLLVAFTMNVGVAIMIEAGLAYLGVGITPPTPAWGVMVSEGYKFLTIHPLMAITPGICIILVVVATNIVGDGIRDAIDPKLRGSI